jgi:hypothetical protein
MLQVILKRSTGSPSYNLKVSSVEHTGQRLPMQAGLPQEQVLLLDLGICVEQITVAGVVDTAPTKLELRAACSSWYGDIVIDKVTKSITGYTELTVVTGETYYGVVKQFSFRLEEAKEDRQDFSFIFLVLGLKP